MVFPLLLALIPILPPTQAAGGMWRYVHQFDGQAAYEDLGWSVAAIGDLDGDGVSDLIIGIPGASPNGLNQAGSVIVRSGLTGALLMQVDGLAANDALGRSVAAIGDTNGDGLNDFVVGAPNADPGGLKDAGSAYLISGANGTILKQFDGNAAGDNMGGAVNRAGDLNADGAVDILAGSAKADPGGISQAGSAWVYSGASGAVLFRFDGASVGDFLGKSVSPAGDVNGDGIPDILVGASGMSSPSGGVGTGSAFVFSGANGAILWRFDGQTPYDEFGHDVTHTGDVNRDGVPDFLVSAPNQDIGGNSDAGAVFLFSGADGSTLHVFIGPDAGSKLGRKIMGGKDVDGDNVPDFLLGAPLATVNGIANAGMAFIYSGETLAPIGSFSGVSQNDKMGKSFAFINDLSGDGIADAICGIPGAQINGNNGAGSVLVVSYNAFLSTTATTVSISTFSSVSLFIDFPNWAAGMSYRVVFSATGVGYFQYGTPIPLIYDALVASTGQGIYPPFGSFQNMSGILDAAGNAASIPSFTFSAGSLPAAALGREVAFCAVAVPPGQLPFAASTARIVRVIP